MTSCIDRQYCERNGTKSVIMSKLINLQEETFRCHSYMKSSNATIKWKFINRSGHIEYFNSRALLADWKKCSTIASLTYYIRLFEHTAQTGQCLGTRFNLPAMKNASKRQISRKKIQQLTSHIPSGERANFHDF